MTSMQPEASDAPHAPQVANNKRALSTLFLIWCVYSRPRFFDNSSVHPRAYRKRPGVDARRSLPPADNFGGDEWPSACVGKSKTPAAPAGDNGRQPRHLVAAVAKRNSKRARHLRPLSPKMSFTTPRRVDANKIIATRDAATTYDMCRQKRDTRQSPSGDKYSPWLRSLFYCQHSLNTSRLTP
jgi:hypothetical protein